MGIQVLWDNPEKTIIRYDFSDPWTWDEFYQIRVEGNNMAESVSHPVVVLVNLQGQVSLASGALVQGKKIAKTKPENISMQVIVSTNGLIKSLFPVFARLNPHLANSYRVVPTLEAARALAVELQHAQDSSG